MELFITIVVAIAIVAVFSNWTSSRMAQRELDYRHQLEMAREETRRRCMLACKSSQEGHKGHG